MKKSVAKIAFDKFLFESDLRSFPMTFFSDSFSTVLSFFLFPNFPCEKSLSIVSSPGSSALTSAAHLPSVAIRGRAKAIGDLQWAAGAIPGTLFTKPQSP